MRADVSSSRRDWLLPRFMVREQFPSEQATAHEPWIIRPLEPSDDTATGDDSPSPKGEGWGEGEQVPAMQNDRPSASVQGFKTRAGMRLGRGPAPRRIFFIVISCHFMSFTAFFANSFCHFMLFFGCLAVIFCWPCPQTRPWREIRLPAEYVTERWRPPFWPPPFASSAGSHRPQASVRYLGLRLGSTNYAVRRKILAFVISGSAVLLQPGPMFRSRELHLEATR